MRFDCILPEFSPFRNFKKNIGKLNSLTVRKKKKKKKKSRPTDPIFKFWSGEGNITIFFFGLICMYAQIVTVNWLIQALWRRISPVQQWCSVFPCSHNSAADFVHHTAAPSQSARLKISVAGPRRVLELTRCVENHLAAPPHRPVQRDKGWCPNKCGLKTNPSNFYIVWTMFFFFFFLQLFMFVESFLYSRKRYTHITRSIFHLDNGRYTLKYKVISHTYIIH